MQDLAAPIREQRHGRIRIAAAFTAAEALVLLALLGPLTGLPWWQGYRVFAYSDQLSYAAIATNWSLGDSRLVEPFTQTGDSYYPSLWYQAMGLLSRLTGVPVYVMWTLLGVLVVSGTVLLVGLLAWRMSRRTWAPLLPALALFTGTLSTISVGSWYTELLNHAVLWGPGVSLFTLNAEVAGICLVAVAMTLVLSGDPQNGGRFRSGLIVGAAAILGLIANIHTYAFFSGVVLAVSFTALYSLSRSRSRVIAGVTLVLVVAVLLAGRWLAPVLGPLPVFALLVLAFAPAAAGVIRGRVGLALLTVAAFCITAAPQLVRTALGIVQRDPFLTYRQLSSRGLGVAIPSGLLGALPVILVAAVCGIALWRRGQHTKTSMVLALLVSGSIMSQNDQWGFNQEPYRFWIQFVILAVLLLSPILAWSLVQARTLPTRRQIAFVGMSVAAAIIWITSAADNVGFWHAAADYGVVSMQDARADAVRALVHDREGLVMPSACLEPQVLKVMTGTQVAHYNAGLAWPPNEAALSVFQVKADRAADDVGNLQRADVAYVLTDSACTTEWRVTGDPRLTSVAEQTLVGDHGTSTLTLWRVQPL